MMTDEKIKTNKKIKPTAAVFSAIILTLMMISHIAHRLKPGTAEHNVKTAQAAEPAAAQTTLSTGTANCRYGVSPIDSDQIPWVDTLGAGWFINFGSSAPATLPTNGAEFVPVINVNQKKNGSVYLDDYVVGSGLSGTDAQNYVINLVTSHPGSLWLVGNEPDVPIVQGDIFPQVYARAYHDIYGWIKQADPTAQVGIGGLSMITPGRLQYLDIVWETYIDNYNTTIPVDVWNMHLYILSEYDPNNPNNNYGDGKIALGTDPAIAKRSSGNDPNLCPSDDVYCRAEHDSITIFREQIYNMRAWMKAHGQQNKPFILSEYSLLYPFVLYDDPINPSVCFLMDEYSQCFTAARVNAFMDATFNFLESTDTSLGNPDDNYRLVQQWMWFSLATDTETTGGSSNLLKVQEVPNAEDIWLYATNYSPGDPNALNTVGQNFLNKVSSMATYVNLKAGEAKPVTDFTIAPSTTATVTLAVDFYNNGNQSLNAPFQVTFYQDAAMSQPIGTTTINPVLLGCARHTYSASVQWANLSPGLHQYWVRVDSGDVITEQNPGESDNTISGFVLIDPESVFLPTVTRSLP